jgi:hypothetical protein
MHLITDQIYLYLQSLYYSSVSSTIYRVYNIVVSLEV